tara:strand:+ start:193 stop:393 length:201 start_codon:yes stop_codon:yes gene_type:complete
MKVFKHKVNGKHYRLLKHGENNVNTYLEVDIENNVILKIRFWSDKEYEQKAIIIGFDNLTDINKNK